jgi:hypothetical protein
MCGLTLSKQVPDVGISADLAQHYFSQLVAGTVSSLLRLLPYAVSHHAL